MITIFALAGCGSSDHPGGPGQASVSEERALSEAAEMIARGRPPEPPPSAGTFGAAPAPSDGFSPAPAPSGGSSPPAR